MKRRIEESVNTFNEKRNKRNQLFDHTLLFLKQNIQSRKDVRVVTT